MKTWQAIMWSVLVLLSTVFIWVLGATKADVGALRAETIQQRDTDRTQREEVIDRLARIETKLDGKWK